MVCVGVIDVAGLTHGDTAIIGTRVPSPKKLVGWMYPES